MDFKQAVVVLVSRFPFEMVSQRMNTPPRWKWNDGVPTPRQLRQKAYLLFDDIGDSRKGIVATTSGGISCSYQDGVVRLKFGRNRHVWAEDFEEVEG